MRFVGRLDSPRIENHRTTLIRKNPAPAQVGAVLRTAGKVPMGKFITRVRVEKRLRSFPGLAVGFSLEANHGIGVCLVGYE